MVRRRALLPAARGRSPSVDDLGRISDLVLMTVSFHLRAAAGETPPPHPVQRCGYCFRGGREVSAKVAAPEVGMYASAGWEDQSCEVAAHCLGEENEYLHRKSYLLGVSTWVELNNGVS